MHTKKPEKKRSGVPKVRRVQRREPGRVICGKRVPNRITRGRIVEALRDARFGLSLDEIGVRVCGDWPRAAHTEWMEGVLRGLCRDGILTERGGMYALR